MSLLNSEGLKHQPDGLYTHLNAETSEAIFAVYTYTS